MKQRAIKGAAVKMSAHLEAAKQLMVRPVESERVCAGAIRSQLQDGLAHEGQFGHVEHDFGVERKVFGSHIIRVPFFAKRQIGQKHSEIRNNGASSFCA